MVNIIYIMGKSSSGKDTIYKKLKEKISVNSYILYTTRPQREGEQEGREYHFINRNQFNQLQNKQKVIESRSYNVINSEGKKDIWTYATIADDQWKKDGDFLTIGTLESYTSIKQYLKEHPEKGFNIIPVYIWVDEEEREKRALKRENSQTNMNFEEMKRRLKADNIDFSEENLIKAGIGNKQTFENYDIDECIENILKYVKKERGISN